MTQELFPEIQSATEALEARIAITEAEVVEMKESLRTKKDLIRAWRKALATFNPKLEKEKGDRWLVAAANPPSSVKTRSRANAAYLQSYANALSPIRSQVFEILTSYPARLNNRNGRSLKVSTGPCFFPLKHGP